MALNVLFLYQSDSFNELKPSLGFQLAWLVNMSNLALMVFFFMFNVIKLDILSHSWSVQSDLIGLGFLSLGHDFRETCWTFRVFV
jgi:hypothetical protein